VIASSHLVDPFEPEQTLAPEPRLLSFSARALDAPTDELVRSLAFDLCGAIPRPLGETDERPQEDERARLAFYQVGQHALAIVSDLDRPAARFRVFELLGTGGDTRVRVNLVLVRDPSAFELSRSALEAVAAGRPLGQVRLWGDPTQTAEMRRTIGRQIGDLDPLSLDALAREPLYAPPDSTRLVLDPLPVSDVKVAGELLALLAAMPVEGQHVRPPRRIGVHQERVRREAVIVSWHFEVHRGGTGVVHARRREVESGVERPGLVRTFVVAGLRGAARVRLRDVGGKCAAEIAGSRASVAAIRDALSRSFGGRA
jgi:hypothetical protein